MLRHFGGLVAAIALVFVGRAFAVPPAPPRPVVAPEPAALQAQAAPILPDTGDKPPTPGAMPGGEGAPPSGG
jgi:hypothetical protein